MEKKLVLYVSIFEKVALPQGNLSLHSFTGTVPNPLAVNVAQATDDARRINIRYLHSSVPRARITQIIGCPCHSRSSPSFPPKELCLILPYLLLLSAMLTTQQRRGKSQCALRLYLLVGRLAPSSVELVDSGAAHKTNRPTAPALFISSGDRHTVPTL